MSVHKRLSNDTYYVSYRDADGRQRTKTFGKGREGKRDAQRFDEEINVGDRPNESTECSANGATECSHNGAIW